jgi:ribonuclease G
VRKEIIVDINPFQTRVVLLEDGEPAEIYIEQRGKERLAGNIYKGRVRNVLPGMQAAFVDIGLERNAYLYAGDVIPDRSEFQFDARGESLGIPNIRDVVKPGQEIIVQVTKEPVNTKGARVTTHITLPGRTLVLMPMADYVGVSRRIDDEALRLRLREAAERTKPKGMGIIIRTVATDKSEEDFAADAAFLERLWQRILQKGKMLSAPRLIHSEEALVFRTIRDIFTPDIDKLVINDRAFYERIKVVAGILSPKLPERVELYRGEDDLFDAYGLESASEKALLRKVWLKSGGYMIIDQTEALTAIDVNTGKYIGNDSLQETILQTNCEAAREAARQLRLRDISGIIVIDFIDMEAHEDQEKVMQTLHEALRNDRTKSNVLGITQLGLLEMTRKKTRQSISHTLQSTCPYCNGDGRVLSRETILLKIRKRLINAYTSESHANYLLTTHPAIAQAIAEHSETEPLLPKQPGRTIWLKPENGLHLQQYHLTPLVTDEELRRAQVGAQGY